MKKWLGWPPPDTTRWRSPPWGRRAWFSFVTTGVSPCGSSSAPSRGWGKLRALCPGQPGSVGHAPDQAQLSSERKRPSHWPRNCCLARSSKRTSLWKSNTQRFDMILQAFHTSFFRGWGVRAINGLTFRLQRVWIALLWGSSPSSWLCTSTSRRRCLQTKTDR